MRKQKIKILSKTNKWNNKTDMVRWIIQNKKTSTNETEQIHKNKKTNVTIYSYNQISMATGKHKICKSLHGPGRSQISWSDPNPFYYY